MKTKKAPTNDFETIMPILIGAWRRLRKEQGPPDVLQTREFRSVVDAVKTLQKGGQDLFAKQELLAAYLLYQWPVHYQQGMSLIGELPEPPKRVLDICSGPAPFAFAALRHGAREVFATDKNGAALELGAEVCGRYGLPLSIRKWDCTSQPLPVEGKFDLIILGHGLEELFPDTHKGWQEKQHQFITALLARLTPRGHLLLVESSYQDANRRVLMLRDQLVKEGVPVQAPCVWKGECPALQAKNSPCYAQREFEKPYLVKEIQRGADIMLSSLKMTYIIFRSPQAQWPVVEEGRRLYRVISPPVESFHGKRYYLCGTDGKKNLGSHFKEQPPEARAFDYLRRGELIAIENPLEKQNALDIVEGTKVEVEAACGKPYKEPE